MQAILSFCIQNINSIKMTCIHCCGADKFFDLKSAQKEMKKFKRKGTRKATKKLLDLLFDKNIENKSLLDIGGGVGAIQWNFLEKGGKSTLDVDASHGYLKVAREYAKENDQEDKAKFLFGDFVDVSDEVEHHDFVTMDKVLCCYPDYKILLDNALKKCNNTIVISYPLGGLITKLVNYLPNFYMYLIRNTYRSYVHSPREIEQFIIDRGFKVVKKNISFPWHVQSYNKVAG